VTDIWYCSKPLYFFIFSIRETMEPRLKRQVGSRLIHNSNNAQAPWSEGEYTVDANTPEPNMRNRNVPVPATTYQAPFVSSIRQQSKHRRKSWAEPVPQPETASPLPHSRPSILQPLPFINPHTPTPYVPSSPLPRSSLVVGQRNLLAGGARAKTRRRRQHRRRTLTRKSRR